MHGEFIAVKFYYIIHTSLGSDSNIILCFRDANLDLTESAHQEIVKNLIFEDKSVVAAIVGVAREDSCVLVGWGRNSTANGLQCLEF